MERLQEELTGAIGCAVCPEPRALPCSPFLPAVPAGAPARVPGLSCLSCPRCRALVPVLAPRRCPAASPSTPSSTSAGSRSRPGPGTCGAHPRQPLNIYCLRERQLVSGRCLTIGQHRGHPIDDLQSVCRKARGASGRLLEELTDKSRSKVFSCSETLQQQQAWCRSTLQRDRKAVLKYFKELGDALEHKKEALLSALDELDSCISEKYDPLIEDMEELKLGESELKELHSAVQEEESPLPFLEKLDGLQRQLHALRGSSRTLSLWRSTRGWRTWCRTCLKLPSVRSTRSPLQSYTWLTKAKALESKTWHLHSGSLLPSQVLSCCSCFQCCPSGNEEMAFGALPAPLVHLWRSLLRSVRIAAPPCSTECKSCAALLPHPWRCAGEFFLIIH